MRVPAGVGEVRMTWEPYWPLMRADAMVNFEPKAFALRPQVSCSSQEVAPGGSCVGASP